MYMLRDPLCEVGGTRIHAQSINLRRINILLSRGCILKACDWDANVSSSANHRLSLSDAETAAIRGEMLRESLVKRQEIACLWLLPEDGGLRSLDHGHQLDDDVSRKRGEVLDKFIESRHESPLRRSS